MHMLAYYLIGDYWWVSVLRPRLLKIQVRSKAEIKQPFPLSSYPKITKKQILFAYWYLDNICEYLFIKTGTAMLFPHYALLMRTPIECHVLPHYFSTFPQSACGVLWQSRRVGTPVAYDAADTQDLWWRTRNLLRECLARTKAVYYLARTMACTRFVSYPEIGLLIKRIERVKF